jgi:Tfp pilus assembly protein PilX
VRRRAHGYILVELVISLVLLGLIAVTFGSSMRVVARVNHHHLVRQRCLSAAEAQLDSIVATGEEISDADVRALWPGVTVAVSRRAGAGDWAGFTLVEAVATATSLGRPVSETLRRYVPTEDRP